MERRNLSIGDWVCIGECGQHVGEIGSVVAISAESNYVGILTTHIIEECEDDVLPIPLTLEILERNGFAFKHRGIEFDHYETTLKNGKTLLLSFDRGDHYYLMYEVKGERGLHQIDCPLGYVHQLQHALRLLEVDKDIIL